MPLTQAQETTLTSLKRLREASKQRSTTRAQKEYEASHRASSRLCSPSGRKASTNSDNAVKKKKHPFGVRGDRPGRIVQPASNYGATSLDNSPEPLTPTKTNPDLQIETQHDGSVKIVHISRKKAIRLATKFLNQDASAFSSQTLKKVLGELPSLDEDDSPGPLEIERGNAPPQLGPAEQTILGSRPQSPNNGSAYEAEFDPEAADNEIGGGASTPALGKLPGVELDVEEPAGNTPIVVENTDTEAESEFHVTELGPSDSVSQQLPRIHTPAPARVSNLRSTRAETRTPPLRRTTLPQTPHLNQRKVPGNTQDELDDGATDSDEDFANPRKRLRLAQPLAKAHAQQASRPPPLGILRPSSSKVSPLPLRAARHMPPRSGGSHKSLPPPTSDIKSALAWALDFAKEQARSRASTSQGAGSSQSQSDFSVLAQVLGEIQTLADSALPSRPIAWYPPTILQSTDFISDHVAILEAQADIALGKRTRVRKQPALSDYPGLPGRIASLAIPELIATAIAEGPYEGNSANDEWAMDVFRAVADRQTGGDDVEDPPRPLRGLMIRRISCFRGDALDRIRPLTIYCREFISAPDTIADDPATKTDPYEDPHLREYIALVLFWAPDSLGVIFHKKFYPLPIPFIAFVLTLMQHAIGEWKTGRHIKAELDSKVQGGIYESHVLGLLKYEKKASGRFEEFREDAFWYGINHAGVGDELHEPHQPVTEADMIRPDSPATKARAKGKGRAAH
ncbi:hypothetical protein RhiJN_23097 [Ceratobasidium sp. AG-Ba]|nr:hypothetical protein RhiJN_23097 [Ceratobasidium sp. AG-Ba]